MNSIYSVRLSPGQIHHTCVNQHKWLQTLDNKGSVRALFVNFRKAFDIVNHNILFTKLKNFNTSHCLLKWFASYLFHRCQRVRVRASPSKFPGFFLEDTLRKHASGIQTRSSVIHCYD